MRVVFIGFKCQLVMSSQKNILTWKVSIVVLIKYALSLRNIYFYNMKRLIG